MNTLNLFNHIPRRAVPNYDLSQTVPRKQVEPVELKATHAELEKQHVRGLRQLRVGEYFDVCVSADRQLFRIASDALVLTL